ncbi:MAG: response regulator [Gammaproteobacteria bacterium]|nr:response regulator [Gammaproteobacteria bacterium]
MATSQGASDMEVVEKLKDQKITALKVLIADDDPPTRILLRAALSQWGYEIIEAKDGEEAWDILQQPNTPRLLILDWLMPKLDGLGLCQKIKEKPDYHPYIILLTQMTGTTNIVKGLEAGANEFLSKPFNMVELRSRLFVGARIIQYETLANAASDALKKNAEIIEKTYSLLREYANELKETVEHFSTDINKEKDAISRIQAKMEEKAGDLEAFIKKSDQGNAKT